MITGRWEPLRDSLGSIICWINKSERAIEIKSKGCRTVVRFNNDKTVTSETKSQKTK